MSNINFAQITIQGRLTGDPEVNPTSNGSTRCNFRVAVNRRIGKDTEKTSFIPVVVFGKEAINCGEYLSKGRSVMVSGEFEADEYEDREGNKRTGFSVVAQKVIFGSGGRSSEDGDSDNSDGPRSFGSKTSRDSSAGSTSRGKGQAEQYMNKNRGRGYDKGR